MCQFIARGSVFICIFLTAAYVIILVFILTLFFLCLKHITPSGHLSGSCVLRFNTAGSGSRLDCCFLCCCPSRSLTLLSVLLRPCILSVSSHFPSQTSEGNDMQGAVCMSVHRILSLWMCVCITPRRQLRDKHMVTWVECTICSGGWVPYVTLSGITDRSNPLAIDLFISFL